AVKVPKTVHSYDRQEQADPPMRAAVPETSDRDQSEERKEKRPAPVRKTEREEAPAPRAEPKPSRDDVPAPVPETEVLNVDVLELEKIGTLQGSMGGGLGIDVWYGSTRESVTQNIRDLPVRSR